MTNVLNLFDIDSAVRHVETALARNPKCSAGMVARNSVFGIQHGPSGGPELLAILYADDSFFGYWYGHILRHPENPGVFVSLIVWSEKLVNAKNIPLFFQRFHYWIEDRLYYEPCTIQSPNDAYWESNSFNDAAAALAIIISQFDFDKRSGFEGSNYESDPSEMRILQIYGLSEVKDDNGIGLPFPLTTSLEIVKNRL